MAAQAAFLLAVLRAPPRHKTAPFECGLMFLLLRSMHRLYRACQHPVIVHAYASGTKNANVDARYAGLTAINDKFLIVDIVLA
jgi:hypothetical protein